MYYLPFLISTTFYSIDEKQQQRGQKQLLTFTLTDIFSVSRRKRTASTFPD